MSELMEWRRDRRRRSHTKEVHAIDEDALSDLTRRVDALENKPAHLAPVPDDQIPRAIIEIDDHIRKVSDRGEAIAKEAQDIGIAALKALGQYEDDLDAIKGRLKAIEVFMSVLRVEIDKRAEEEERQKSIASA